MQQTQTYKLNLIETSDVFSPNPLNENTQKTEAALLAEADAREALDSRVQVLELRRMVAGPCGGSYGTQFDLGFQPKVVIAGCATIVGVATPEHTYYKGGAAPVRITETGFAVGSEVQYGGVYVAFG